MLSHAGDHNLLMGNSVEPLINLMRDRGVTRLVCPERSRHLSVEGEFANPRAPHIKSGNFRSLENRGDVFRDQNTTINPFYAEQ